MLRTFIFLLVCFMMSAQVFAKTSSDISERAYKQLTRVHKLMDDERYDQALKRLNAIRLSDKRPYEQAIVWQAFGYLYAAKVEYAKAIEAFLKCLTPKTLPDNATKNTLYTLAKLQISVADYTEAIDTLERWFDLENKPTPEAHALAGMAYAQAKRHGKAIEHLRKAIASPDGKREEWYRQLLVVYYDTVDYRSAARLMEEMTRRFPERKAYWLQLSSIYRTLKDDARSLAVMELAYRQGLLLNERELVELASYYLYMDMPYKAGDLLETALQSGSISSTGNHWRLLSDAWLQAREMQRALRALQRASKLVEDPEVFLRLAQLASQMDEWSVTLHATNKALHMAGLEQPGKVHILEGVAHFNKEDYRAAKEAFEHAKKYAAVQNQARKWLEYLSAEASMATTDPTAH